MTSTNKKAIVFGGVAAVVLLSFIGLTIATMPLHTSQTELRNQFVLQEEFKKVRKTLQKVDIATEALAMNDGKLLYEETVYRDIDLNGLRNWEFRQITHIGAEIEGTTLHLQSDTHAVPSSIDVLVTLRQPNNEVGLQQLRQSIRIVPMGETQTLVTHESLVSVTRKCPTRFQPYMDKKVQEAVAKDIQTVEYLMRYYTER